MAKRRKSRSRRSTRRTYHKQPVRLTVKRARFLPRTSYKLISLPSVRVERPTVRSVYRQLLEKPVITRQRFSQDIAVPVSPSVRKFSTFVHEIDRALTCARRSIRKEVLFATGRGGASRRKPSNRPRSKVRC